MADDDKTEKPTHEFEAEIFSVGTWNGDTYTAADLDEMAANFSELAEAIKPPITPGHTREKGQMAFGWVTALRRQGQKLVARFSQVPDVVYRAIIAGRFKRVSAEILWNLRHAGRVYRRVLSGVAILGAELPAVTNLADLEAYLTRSTDPESGSFERAACYGFALGSTAAASGLTINEEETDVDEKKYQEMLDAEKAQREAAEAEAREYKAKYEAEQERQAAERKAQREAQFKAYCEEQVQAGKMTPAAREVLVKDLDRRCYTDAAGLQFGPEDIRAVFDAQGKVLPEGQKAEGDGNGAGGRSYERAGIEVDRRAKTRAAERKLDYSAALKAVLAEDAELARAYQDEALALREENA
jgi:hypothetical protein